MQQTRDGMRADAEKGLRRRRNDQRVEKERDFGTVTDGEGEKT